MQALIGMYGQYLSSSLSSSSLSHRHHHNYDSDDDVDDDDEIVFSYCDTHTSPRFNVMVTNARLKVNCVQCLL